MHPIDVAYKRTADEISEILSKITAEVGEIELLATTKIATLYDGKIAALRATAMTMESQVNELKALIGEDCGAVGGEDTAPPKEEHDSVTSKEEENSVTSKEEQNSVTSKEEKKSVTPSEWNSLARERNATISRVNEYLMPLCDHRDQPIPHFPSTAYDLKKMTHNEVMAIHRTLGLTPAGDLYYDLGQLAARIGISESLWCRLGFSAMYILPYSLSKP